MNPLPLACFLLLTALLARAEPLVLTDLDGRKHDLFAVEETKAAVIVFVSVDCPIANFYQPTLRQLAARFEKQGVAFFQVHPDPELKPEEARQHAKDFGVTTPVVIDAGQSLVRRLGARVTPEAFIVTRDLKTVYRGRIDDTYTTYGKRRPEPTSRDLEAALTAVLADKNVAIPKTKAIGCQIFVDP